MAQIPVDPLKLIERGYQPKPQPVEGGYQPEHLQAGYQPSAQGIPTDLPKGGSSIKLAETSNKAKE